MYVPAELRAQRIHITVILKERIFFNTIKKEAI